MRLLMTAALLSVLAMGTVEARPMIMGCDRPMMGEGIQNFYFYFGRGCNTCATTCDACARDAVVVGDVVGGVFGGPVRMVRGVTNM